MIANFLERDPTADELAALTEGELAELAAEAADMQTVGPRHLENVRAWAGRIADAVAAEMTRRSEHHVD